MKKLQLAGCKTCVSYFTYFDHVCSSGFVRTPHQGFSQAAATVKKISTQQIFFLSCGTTDALSVFEVILGGSLDCKDGGVWRTSKQRLQRAAENISSDCQRFGQWTSEIWGKWRSAWIGSVGEQECHGGHLTWQHLSTRGQPFASFPFQSATKRIFEGGLKYFVSGFQDIFKMSDS